jgi:NAD(P)-dependent dehydrogenase (short-subunit alcohol dehydrogenase family)
MNLDGARVWVTGASSGIGAAVVPVLAARGARVAVSARRADLLESLATRWRRGGAEILVAPVDVTDRTGVIAAVRSIEATWGGIELALLNAGGHRSPEGAGFDTSQFVDVMTVNYFGVLYGIEAVLPGMLARGGGRIVNVASGAAYLPGSTNTSYSGSKAAVHRFSEALALQLEPHGIPVFSISPGLVRTRMTESFGDDMPWTPPELAPRLVRALASGRLDGLAGRYLHAEHDHVDDLARRVDEIVADDLNAIRLRR